MVFIITGNMTSSAFELPSFYRESEEKVVVTKPEKIRVNTPKGDSNIVFSGDTEKMLIPDWSPRNSYETSCRKPSSKK